MAFLSSKAKRQAANEDISRLLEPEYAPSPPRRSHQLSLIRDENGDLHDPDYRPFSPISRPKSPPRRQQPSPRPYWETVLPSTQVDDEDSEDEEEEVYERRLSDGYAFSPNYAQRRSAQYFRDQYLYSHSYAHSYSPSYANTSPSTTQYSPPTSYDSEVTVLDEEKERHGWACALRNKLTNNGSEKDVEVSSEKQKEKKSLVTKDEDVPTCGEALRRRWVILRFSMQFRMFRAQRRMKRIQSLMSTTH